MVQKISKQQKINYLQSLSDRSPEEEAVLEKLLSSKKPIIYSASSVQDYQRQKIKQYYNQKASNRKISKHYQLNPTDSKF
jgi:hypothetical protein